jgi:hypothetical protein
MADAAQQLEQPAPQPKEQTGDEDVASWIRGRGNRPIEGYSQGQNDSEADPAKPTEPGEKEEAAPEKAPEEKKQERLDKGFAALKTQRKELAKKERTIQIREATLAQAQREHFEHVELLKKDPYEFMRKHGVSARDVAKRAVDEQETPEQIKLRELTEKYERQERELEEWRTHRQQTAKQTEEQQGVSIVTSYITEHESDYPLLSGEDPTEIVAALKSYYQRELEPVGQVLDDATVRDVFAHFESNLRAKAERYAQRLNGKSTGGPAQASPSERGNGAVQSAKPEATEAPALSNFDAGARATPPRPLTRQERFDRAANLLRFSPDR